MNVGCIPKKLMHQAAILGMFFSQTICVIAKGNVLEQVFKIENAPQVGAFEDQRCRIDK